MNNQPIGILDSGVGGLSVWQEVVKELPSESIIYLADSKNCPYGQRSKEEIYRLSKRLVSFLIKENVKALIIACNSITVSCLGQLRKDFPNLPIIGTVPVIKTASSQTKNGKIGILSTNATAKSEYQKKLIKNFAKGLEVINLGTDRLVSFVERGELGSGDVKKKLIQDLKPFKDKKVDVIALGCTHFPFLRSSIKNILGENIILLDSSLAIARQVRRVLVQNKHLSASKNPSYIFYTTGSSKDFKKVMKKLTGDFPNKTENIREAHV